MSFNPFQHLFNLPIGLRVQALRLLPRSDLAWTHQNLRWLKLRKLFRGIDDSSKQRRKETQDGQSDGRESGSKLPIFCFSDLRPNPDSCCLRPNRSPSDEIIKRRFVFSLITVSLSFHQLTSTGSYEYPNCRYLKVWLLFWDTWAKG